MHYVYILHSEKLNRFYIGETHDVETRLKRHNNDYYDDKWSAKGKPWTLFLEIECNNKTLALQIERHIKTMKNRVYIQNLKSYPEIIENLNIRYAPDCSSVSRKLSG